MRYIGSKTSTLPTLERLVTSRVTTGTFCDPFGGIASVGAAFKRLGFEIHTGDLLTAAYCFQVARVVLNSMPAIPQRLADEADTAGAPDITQLAGAARPAKSWVYREYSLRRNYFTPGNAMRIDGVRRRLARWKRLQLIDELTDAYLRACLIDSTDRVANTAGTYYAHLKRWSRKALNGFELRPIQPAAGASTCTATIADASHLVAERHYTVLYLDPPYNQRDYGAYYHFPETLAKGRRPRPRGLSGIDQSPRPHTPFTKPAHAQAAFGDLLDAARFDLLVIHYSDDGLVSPACLRSMLRSRGRLKEHVIHALGYGTTSSRRVRHRIYLVES